MNRQSVDRYMNGERLPDLPSIYQLCKKMNVTADWLLGMSDVRQPSAEIRAVCEFTGLSESAIGKISNPDIGNPIGKRLSKIIESENFYHLMLEYKKFLESADKLKDADINVQIDLSENTDQVVLSRNEATRHYMHQVSLAMMHICEEEYFVQMDQASEKARKKWFDEYSQYIHKEDGNE